MNNLDKLTNLALDSFGIENPLKEKEQTREDKLKEIMENAYESGENNTYIDEILYDEIGNFIYDLEEENEIELTGEEKGDITTQFIQGYLSGFNYLKGDLK
jgi:hypothetical protein